MKIHIDIETRSRADLPDVGAYRYGIDPSTQVFMAGVSEDHPDAPVYLWINPLFRDAGVASDPEALELMAQADEARAHNAPFEQPVLHGTAFRPYIPLEKWRCTQVMARLAGLPESLEKCGDALGIATKKDSRGKALIRLFSIPNEDGTFNEPRDHREKWAQFCEYCRQDVRAEKEIHRLLRPKFDLKGQILETFQFTLRMNSLGIPVNVPALKNAQAIINKVQAGAGMRFQTLTGVRITQRAKVLEWLRARGVKLENMQADTLMSLDRSGLAPDAVEAISLYIQLSYAAAKKVTTMLDWVMPDGRMRGVFNYYGASTGRWSAGGPQLQNAKKPTPEMRPVTKPAYKAICNGAPAEGISAIYGEPMEVIASCVRHFIHHTGDEMLDADYNAIEARIICWLAGEKEMLAMWAKGADLYKVMASRIYGVPVSAVTPDQRDMGKRTILGCFGYDTPVLTRDGWKPIGQISRVDWLWDGVDWVQSEGAVYQGCKQTMDLCGVDVTPDHRILCGAQWLPARQVAHDERTLCQALETGLDCFPSRVTGSEFVGASYRSQFDAIAAPTSISSIHAICEKDAPLVAIAAPKNRPDSGRKNIAGIRISSPMISCASGFSIGFPHASADATALLPECTDIMGEEGFVSTRRGGKTGEDFSSTLFHYRITTRLNGKSTASIVTADTSLIISGLRPIRRTWAIAEAFPKCSRGLQNSNPRFGDYKVCSTYDVVNAGPRNRFTILTSRGPMIVHNCGYGMGAAKFLATCQTFGVTCDAALAERCVTTYRDAHQAITAYWRRLNRDAMESVRRHGVRQREFIVESAAGRSYLFATLPSGRRLAYPDPQIEIDPQFGDQLTYWGQLPMTQQWGRIKLYGGKLAENASQAIAADIMSHGARVAESRGMAPFALIHDQGLALRAGHSAEEFAAALADLPEWAKGLPLKAEAKVTPFYSK